MNDMNQIQKAEVEHRDQWLRRVADNGPALRQLVADYHPSARRRSKSPIGPITAPAAEQACSKIRQDIQAKESEDPLSRWDTALASGDVSTLMSLLDGAWFGVPESTSCWNIPGFDVAVDLLDDPPEQESREN